MIIGINGKIGSGKDTVAKIIEYLSCNMSSKADWKYYNHPEKWYADINDGKYQFKWQIKKFAYAVKQICSILTGIPVEDFEKEEVKDSYLGEEWDWGGQGHGPRYTVRQFMQMVGTNAMRDVIHPDVWVNALMRQHKSVEILPETDPGIIAYTPKYTYPNWLISDVRFPNEARAIKDRNGIVIKIHRQHNREGKVEHESETALNGYEFDYIIQNTGTIEDLIVEVKQMLTHFNLI